MKWHKPTPVGWSDGIWFKRDDLFTIAGASGGKARTIWSMVPTRQPRDFHTGITTAGSRNSLQVSTTARIARWLKLPFRAHVPTGELGNELLAMEKEGCEIIQHKAGYNSVLIARAKADAQQRGWFYVPFGLECHTAVTATKTQVINIPIEVKRLVVPIGFGMTLAGILCGLRDIQRRLPVFGLVVGADPSKRLNLYAPKNWHNMVHLQRSVFKYHEPYVANQFGSIILDPFYEAKCIPYLRKGDCLWIVACREGAKDGTV